ncbi:MAG TPA: LON peptidase substrate-binding domain-containing protein, partial [Candidatus Sumerlaeota bacterium]|nr:LON peptidase substrate-binding domain-containing protein [Candidatus Sumerlaeota bacterium]
MKESENVIMPVIPMRDMVIFPNTINPVFISRPASISALEQAMAHDRKLLFVTQMIADEENPGPEDLHSVGTVCHVLQMLRTGEGVVKVLLEGLYAATIANFMRSASVLQAVFVPRKPVWTKNRRMQALTRAILSQFEKFCELSDRIPDDLYYSISGIENPEHLTDSIANYSSIRISEKQSILEENNIERKFAVIIKCLAGEIELLEMQKKILDEVKERMGDSQKKFFLNEQLRVIEQELGIIGDDDP